MLSATQWEQLAYTPRTRREPTNGRQVRETHEETTFIEVQHYLDFKYGTNCVTVTLPDESRVNLVVGADGRIYVEVPVTG